MSPKQLKILKNLFSLSKKEREEVIKIFEQPSATSSNGLILSNNSNMTVAYFINELKNDSNFQAIVNKIHQASELGIASE